MEDEISLMRNMMDPLTLMEEKHGKMRMSPTGIKFIGQSDQEALGDTGDFLSSNFASAVQLSSSLGSSSRKSSACSETLMRSMSPDEEDYLSAECDNGQNYFDSVVGAIEDIVMDEEFQALQKIFLDKYWPEFSEDQTENLHSHFEIFKEYSQAMSTFIEEKLKNVLDHFDMEMFVEQLGARGTDLDGDIFDMLFTLIDYVKFKELLLDYRAMREGKTCDLSSGICVRPVPSRESMDTGNSSEV